MARTKQTARKSTGGPAPRKQQKATTPAASALSAVKCWPRTALRPLFTRLGKLEMDQAGNEIHHGCRLECDLAYQVDLAHKGVLLRGHVLDTIEVDIVDFQLTLCQGNMRLVTDGVRDPRTAACEDLILVVDHDDPQAFRSNLAWYEEARAREPLLIRRALAPGETWEREDDDDEEDEPAAAAPATKGTKRTAAESAEADESSAKRARIS